MLRQWPGARRYPPENGEIFVKAAMSMVSTLNTVTRVVQACGRVCLSTLCLSLPIVGTAAAIRVKRVARGGETGEIFAKCAKISKWVTHSGAFEP